MGLADRITTNKPPLKRNNSGEYKATFRQSAYARPVVSRLTPLAKFMITLAGIAVFAVLVLVLNRAMEMASSNESVASRFKERPVVQVTIYAPKKSAEKEQQAPAPRAEPTAVPTQDPTRASWAAKLKKQPDGTLLPPASVVAQAVADLGAYFGLQNNMPLDTYLAQREAIFNTYLTGALLNETRQVEATRDLYAMNRAGKYTVEVRKFSPDGLSAKAAIIKRDWVSDVYDVATKQLVAAGRTYMDTLTVLTVVYDQADGRWKFAAVDEVVELQP